MRRSIPPDAIRIFTLDRPLTAEYMAGQYNNFYEFSGDKDDVWRKVKDFTTRPWLLDGSGLVRNPVQLDLNDLLRMMPIEERVYRYRCVEAWAMAVPWTGFPLKALVDHLEPFSTARYVCFTSFQANVDPAIAHPRWSQRTERMIGTGQRLDTLHLNGYERWARSLYS